MWISTFCRKISVERLRTFQRIRIYQILKMDDFWLSHIILFLPGTLAFLSRPSLILFNFKKCDLCSFRQKFEYTFFKTEICTFKGCNWGGKNEFDAQCQGRSTFCEYFSPINSEKVIDKLLISYWWVIDEWKVNS